jgi:hypothetical protein
MRVSWSEGRHPQTSFGINDIPVEDVLMNPTLPEMRSPSQLPLLKVKEPSVPLSLYERQVLEAILVRTKNRLERAEKWRSKAVHECTALRQRVAELVQRLNG